jgi:hypothetical protein
MITKKSGQTRVGRRQLEPLTTHSKHCRGIRSCNGITVSVKSVVDGARLFLTRRTGAGLVDDSGSKTITTGYSKAGLVSTASRIGRKELSEG